VGELDGGEIRGNRISGWDRHPELPLFRRERGDARRAVAGLHPAIGGAHDSLNVAEGGIDADQIVNRDDGDDVAR
jgi:hypothetical protein